MVADMLRLAAVDAFDAMVLVSGDADHAPAIEGVRSIGKQVFVATWSGKGLSARSRRAAFDHIDIESGAEVFATERKAPQPDEPPPQGQIIAMVDQTPVGIAGGPTQSGDEACSVSQGEAVRDSEEEFLKELRRAMRKFAPGYVGANYFVTRWKAPALTSNPDARRRILDGLVAAGQVEVYLTDDGKKALRTK